MTFANTSIHKRHFAFSLLGAAVASVALLFPTAPANAWSWAEAAKPYAGSTIRILDEITPLQETMVQQAHLFTEETGINVEIEILSHYDVIRRGEADMLAGRGHYDGVMIHSNQLGTVLAANAARPITEFIENDALTSPDLDLDDLIQPGWYAGSKFGDDVYSFLTWNYISVYAARNDLLTDPEEQASFEEKYGYPLAPAETMEQLRDIAEFFTRSRGDTLAGETLTSDFYGIVLEGLRYEMFFEGLDRNFIMNWGGSIFSESGEPTFDRPENIAAIQFWADLWKFSPPGQAEYSVIDIPTVMGNGIAAQSLVYADFMLGIDKPGASRHAGQFVYRPIPRNAEYDGDRSAYGLPSSVVISRHSQNPEATYLFLQWLVQKETQNVFIETQDSWVPVRESSFSHPIIVNSPYAEANLYEAMRESMRYNTGSHVSANLFEILDRAGGLAQQIGLGQLTADEGMRAMQHQVLGVCTSCLIVP